MTTTADIREHAPRPANHVDCFACGPSHPVGLRLGFRRRPDGSVSAVWTPSRSHRSYADRVHGGLIALLLDSAMVHALAVREFAGVTLRLNTRYLQVVCPEEPVVISGRVDCLRLGVGFCSAEVLQAGRTAARATGTFKAISQAL